MTDPAPQLSGSVADVFARTAARCPARDWLQVLPETAQHLGIDARTWTYTEADAEVQRLRATYARAGLGRGHRAGLLLLNRPEFLLHWLALNGLGRFDEALACLDRVVALEPRDPNAWVEKGRSLTRSGRREEALDCFDRAIAINPWHLAALYEKGVCLLFLGRFEEAAACIGEVAAIQPGPAIEAARQACLAGLPSRNNGPPGGSGTTLEPIDDLDLRT